jgi:hypothetical protein
MTSDRAARAATEPGTACPQRSVGSSIPTALPAILLAARHLPETREYKKRQIRLMIRFVFQFGGTGGNRTRGSQRLAQCP